MSAKASAVVQPATAGDLPDALVLLRAAGLPVAGVEAHFPARFVVARAADGSLAGMAGVEMHGRAALLRSVAVAESARGQGLGVALTRAAIDLARHEGADAVHLLTTTAESFFPRLGFERVERGDLPAALAASEELRGACPASAVPMRLRLTCARRTRFIEQRPSPLA
ncbi:MAG TPA: arsenic resistance N-acetyltransferase ArsN2 [Longimicrobiaceae bacterium]|nr:arsenic resistance N-acetyltransferase ArsN2 [Longimicrobiaceae bacterium]